MTRVSDMGHFCQSQSLERLSCASWAVLETNRVFLVYLEGFLETSLNVRLLRGWLSFWWVRGVSLQFLRLGSRVFEM